MAKSNAEKNRNNMKGLSKTELLKERNTLQKQIDAIDEKLSRMYTKEEEGVEEKIKRCLQNKDKFEASELIFASTTRCNCGSGIAYPKNIGPFGSWYCSDILMGKAIPKNQKNSKQHTPSMPFAFYSIKSENQPSAKGETTRPRI